MEGDSHDTPTTVPSPSTSPSASTPEQGTGSEDLVGRFAARQPTFEPQTVERAAGNLNLTSRKTKVNVGMRQTNNKVMTNMTKNLNPDMMENRLLGMTIGAVTKRGIS